MSNHPVPQRTTAPFGTWLSPISAQVVAAQGLRLGYVSIDGDDTYWLEGRPGEGGRNVLVRRSADGQTCDVIPRDANVRTRVHEYGGGAYLVADGMAYYSNFADQRVYQIPCLTGSAPQPLTSEGAWFYADYTIDPARTRLVCVREDHTPRPGSGQAGGTHEPTNALVSIPLVGSAEHGSPHTAMSPGDVIASGHDFYSTPRLSPDGSRLCWLAWNHPNMPWDGTELWVADVTPSGALADARRVAGGRHESIYQPGWSPEGRLYFVSDRDGWWRLCSMGLALSGPTDEPDTVRPTGVVPVVTNPPPDAEFGRPQWQFGWASWAFADRSTIVATYTRAGRWNLATIDVASGVLTDLRTPFEPAEWLAVRPHAAHDAHHGPAQASSLRSAQADSAQALFVGGSATMPQAIIAVRLPGPTQAEAVSEVLRSSSSLHLDPGDVSEPEAIEFPTDGELTAHAFYYAPSNARFTAPPGERPPLVVISHGGPTTATRATLDLQIQFWTTRGFAVADVNYGGSSGFGRPYRERLNGQWGIVDVADNVNAARFLVAQGKADDQRLIIRGGSAGGYTTLAALTFHPEVFKAGASYYGVSDIELLARDTHKFESRYLDGLVGPYPAMAASYRARSPIHFVDRLSCSLILLQGLEDKVVPPNQAQLMADAVRAKGLPVALLMFEGEQHGFRKAETIVRSLEAELYFYGAVFGFIPADSIEPVPIDNL